MTLLNSKLTTTLQNSFTTFKTRSYLFRICWDPVRLSTLISDPIRLHHFWNISISILLSGTGNSLISSPLWYVSAHSCTKWITKVFFDFLVFEYVQFSFSIFSEWRNELLLVILRYYCLFFYFSSSAVMLGVTHFHVLKCIRQISGIRYLSIPSISPHTPDISSLPLWMPPNRDDKRKKWFRYRRRLYLKE